MMATLWIRQHNRKSISRVKSTCNMNRSHYFCGQGRLSPPLMLGLPQMLTKAQRTSLFNSLTRTGYLTARILFIKGMNVYKSTLATNLVYVNITRKQNL